MKGKEDTIAGSYISQMKGTRQGYHGREEVETGDEYSEGCAFLITYHEW